MRDEHYQQDARSADHHWWWSARRKILRRVLQQYIAPDSERKILEVGCSTGSNLPMLATFGDVSALELNDTAAAICRARFPGIVMYHRPIPEPLDDQFDVICAFDVIEHIEDERRTVAWLHRHLQQDGLLFVTVPAMPALWSPHDDDAHHFRRYTRARLTSILDGQFDVEYLTFFNTHLFPLIAPIRLLQRAGVVSLGGRDKEMGGNRLTNPLLKRIFGAETLWIPRFRLPFGVSLLAVARKRSADLG